MHDLIKLIRSTKTKQNKNPRSDHARQQQKIVISRTEKKVSYRTAKSGQGRTIGDGGYTVPKGRCHNREGIFSGDPSIMALQGWDPEHAGLVQLWEKNNFSDNQIIFQFIYCF